MPHTCLIGTSGWNYDHWKGIFYPEHLPSSEWLDFYAREFKTVEINYSFYRLPERENFETWHDETPTGFIFAVKASRYLTHRKKLKDPEEPLERVIGHARGLGDKLGPILYQLPPRWKANPERLRAFLELLPKDLRHVFEFRDPSWQCGQIFDLLREYSAGYCIMSAPDLPRIVQVTAPFAYIRMHSGGAETEGNYELPQLEWWAGQIRELLRTSDVYLYFNNDYQGFALKNARTLIELLTP
ncbi:MAG TPA: DUF72 domain-containing protein [Armatimonadota bacterium]|jgi:uncharacterized protein YecE (DUF72 family)